jgi:glycosyltransferase involved in cell wall biosynthesis
MTNKPKLIFCAPVATVSGYGAHSRDILLSLIKMDKFDIRVISINWGDTPMNALDSDTEDNRLISNLINNNPVTERPDVWVQCTIPNEFQVVGKYNIGITAGIETDTCSGEWIEGCNRMDLVIVPSKHAKRVFENTKYEKRDKTTNDVVGMVEVNVPIEVLHEGVRTDIYNRELSNNEMVHDELDSIPEKFCYLFVGHWMKGDFGQDRKDVSGLLYTFFETFGDTTNPPALILKTSMGTFSVSDRSRIAEKIGLIRQMSSKKNLPNVYVLHGELTDEEMNSLYNHPKVKAFVSFTKGEGYGRPIAEFITTGKPVLVSGWSGQTDFVNETFHTRLKGNVSPVHKSAVWEGVINSDSRWFTVDYQSAGKELKKSHDNYKRYLQMSEKYVKLFNSMWSYDSMHKKFEELLSNYLPTFAEQVSLNLPKLKKISE